MKHCDPFSFNYGIKFVSEGGADNNFRIAQTGDPLGWIIAGILAIIAVGALAFYLVKKHNAKFNMSSQIGGHASATKASLTSGISSKIILGLSVVAFVCSGLAFAGQTVKAIAEGSTPIVEAIVADDGSVSVSPINLVNAKNTDIKFVKTKADLWGDHWGNATLRQTNVSIDFLGQSLYNAVPNGHEHLNDDIVNRIPDGQSADIAISISNLDGEYAKSLIGDTVYFNSFVFEDAVIPVPSHTDYFVYNNEWVYSLDSEVTDDSPYYYDVASQYHEKNACDRVPEPETTPSIVSEDDPVPGDPIPYLATLKLKNAYVWEAFDVVDPDTGVSKRIAPGEDPYSWEWVIDQRTISIDWSTDFTEEYDGDYHFPEPTLSNAAEPHVLSASCFSIPGVMTSDVEYTKGADQVRCDNEDIQDVDWYTATLKTFKVYPEKYEPADPELVKNYKLEDNTFRALQITPKELEIVWDQNDSRIEYDSTIYKPYPDLVGVCTKAGSPDKDDVSPLETYSLYELDSDYYVPNVDPWHVGEYLAEVYQLDGVDAANYAIPELNWFTFEITKKPADSLGLIWPTTTTYPYLGQYATTHFDKYYVDIRPAHFNGYCTYDDPFWDPTTQESLLDLSCWPCTYYVMAGDSIEELYSPLPADALGDFKAFVEPHIWHRFADEEPVDVVDCYEINPRDLEFDFSVVKPSFTSIWAGQYQYQYNNESHAPVLKSVSCDSLDSFVTVPGSNFEYRNQLAYYKVDEYGNIDGTSYSKQPPVNAGKYCAIVEEISIYDIVNDYPLMKWNVLSYNLDAISSEIHIDDQSDYCKFFEITPAKIQTTWENDDPVGGVSLDYNPYGTNQIFDNCGHPKKVTCTTDVEGVSFVPQVSYKIINGSEETELSEGYVPKEAAHYKAFISAITASGLPDDSPALDMDNYVFEDNCDELAYEITQRPFASSKIQITWEDVAGFIPDTASFNYDGDMHKPIVKNVYEEIPMEDGSTSKHYLYISADLEPVIDADVQNYGEQFEKGTYSFDINSVNANYKAAVPITVNWYIVGDIRPSQLAWGLDDGGTTLVLAPYALDTTNAITWHELDEEFLYTDHDDAAQIPWLAPTYPDAITKVKILDADDGQTKIKPKSLSYWFYKLQKVTSIEGFDNIDLSSVKYANSLFNLFGAKDNGLSINLAGSNWPSLQSANSLFYNSGFDQINLAGASFPKLSTATKAFWGAEAKTVDLSNANFNSLEDLSQWLSTCINLKYINFDNVKFGSLKNMSELFESCSNLVSVELKGIDTFYVTDIHQMFWHCGSLETASIDSQFVSIPANTERYKEMFTDCTSLKEIYIGDGWKVHQTAGATAEDMGLPNDKWMHDDGSGAQILLLNDLVSPGTYTLRETRYSKNVVVMRIYDIPGEVKDCKSLISTTNYKYSTESGSEYKSITTERMLEGADFNNGKINLYVHFNFFEGSTRVYDADVSVGNYTSGAKPINVLPDGSNPKDYKTAQIDIDQGTGDADRYTYIIVKFKKYNPALETRNFFASSCLDDSQVVESSMENRHSFNIYDVDLPENENEVTDNENWFKECREVYVYAENKNEEAFTSNIYAVVQHADGSITKEYITENGQPIDVQADNQTLVCKWTIPSDAIDVQFVYGDIPAQPAAEQQDTPQIYGGTENNPIDARVGEAEAPETQSTVKKENSTTIITLQ